VEAAAIGSSTRPSARRATWKRRFRFPRRPIGRSTVAIATTRVAEAGTRTAEAGADISEAGIGPAIAGAGIAR